MLPQINGNVIQFQGCQCPAWLQAVLYHCGLDDDVRRTPPYALRLVLVTLTSNSLTSLFEKFLS